jgi:DNA polymerase III alpha subunit (gram-positive type)
VKQYHFVIDVEADGPAPPVFSMIEIGVVKIVETGPLPSFGRAIAPQTDNFVPEALKSIGVTREESISRGKSPKEALQELEAWLEEIAPGRRNLWSDNPAFDCMWINSYTVQHLGKTLFGHSARRIGDLYCGLSRDLNANKKWKRLRKAPHDHTAVNDALGNAEALIAVLQQSGIKPPW